MVGQPIGYLLLLGAAGGLLAAYGCYTLWNPRRFAHRSRYITRNPNHNSPEYRTDPDPEHVTGAQARAVQKVGIAQVVAGSGLAVFGVGLTVGAPWQPIALNALVLVVAGAAAVKLFDLSDAQRLAAAAAALAGVGAALASSVLAGA